ncbi:MAG: single-stranded DNA-binding protein [Fimbriimonadaceae bacterium]|nr:single-stranded DNA-binding protein [Fimbriimonadaceae bacterium]
MSINRVVLIGRLTRDPELRNTSTGMSVAEFSLAVDKKRKSDDGDNANFFRIKCFGRTADFVTQYLSKGRLVGVDGRLEWRKWQDREGNNRETIEIIADDVQGLDRPRDDAGGGAGGGSAPKAAPAEDDFDPFDD